MTYAELHRKSVYAELLAAGVEMDSHESDLYVKWSKQAQEIIERRCERGKTYTFVSKVDGNAWYDLPFMFDPFWTAKAAR